MLSLGNELRSFSRSQRLRTWSTLGLGVTKQGWLNLKLGRNVTPGKATTTFNLLLVFLQIDETCEIVCCFSDNPTLGSVGTFVEYVNLSGARIEKKTEKKGSGRFQITIKEKVRTLLKLLKIFRTENVRTCFSRTTKERGIHGLILSIKRRIFTTER